MLKRLLELLTCRQQPFPHIGLEIPKKLKRLVDSPSLKTLERLLEANGYKVSSLQIEIESETDAGTIKIRVDRLEDKRFNK